MLSPLVKNQCQFFNLQADDENDHDSLNQSGAEGQGSSGHLPGLLADNGTDGGGGVGGGGTGAPEPSTAATAPSAAAGSAVEQQLILQQQSTNSSTPVVRPTTPTSKRLFTLKIGDDDYE